VKGKIRIYVSVKRDEDESTTVVHFNQTELSPHEVIASIKSAAKSLDDSPKFIGVHEDRD
jgi:hypothetical protein